MLNESSRHCPHLPSVSIIGFRGIDNLKISRLGRVTLLAGRNGIGKTTVLDAVRIYAARGRPSVLQELLEKREEYETAFDEDHDPVLFPDYASLFYGRDKIRTNYISIGPSTNKDEFRIEVSKPSDWSDPQKEFFEEIITDLTIDSHVQAIKIIYGKNENLLPWFIAVDERGHSNDRKRQAAFQRRRFRRHLNRDWFDNIESSEIDCTSMGPGLLSNNTLARFWDRVALTEGEELSIQALRLVLGDRIERLAVVGDDESRYRGDGRRTVVKLRDHSHPVPLKSLGDGVIRMFSVGLALANSRDGFLLVDEAENGIHYSVQKNFWKMVLHSADKNNVQVLATTHSYDCVKGFARAVAEDNSDGILVRLEQSGSGIRAVEYTEADLETAAEQDIEVR